MACVRGHEAARSWLAGHGLPEVRPTPLPARRLAVRWHARLIAQVLPAAVILAVGLTYAGTWPAGAAVAGSGSYQRWPLPLSTTVVVALVLAHSLLDWWVRRVDRRAATTLQRRAAHPVRLGWRAVLGRPRAALTAVTFTAVTFAGATAPAIASLTVHDPAARYAGVVLLITLCGVTAGMVIQLRHVLTYPVVADDAASLDADPHAGRGRPRGRHADRGLVPAGRVGARQRARSVGGTPPGSSSSR